MLDDYNNKKEEAQEAVQDVAEVDLEELERELAEKEKALEESEEETRFDGRLQAEKRRLRGKESCSRFIY